MSQETNCNSSLACCSCNSCYWHNQESVRCVIVCWANLNSISRITQTLTCKIGQLVAKMSRLNGFSLIAGCILLTWFADTLIRHLCCYPFWFLCIIIKWKQNKQSMNWIQYNYLATPPIVLPFLQCNYIFKYSVPSW